MNCCCFPLVPGKIKAGKQSAESGSYVTEGNHSVTEESPHAGPKWGCYEHPKDALGCILENWAQFKLGNLKRNKLILHCNETWLQYQLHVAVQVSQHHLLKRLSLFHWLFSPALSKISWTYISGSISGFSILSH